MSTINITGQYFTVNNYNAETKKYRSRRNRDRNRKIRNLLSSRMHRALKTNKKLNDTVNLLGCDIGFFKRWLEFQFDKTMSWDNRNMDWEIDHIKPCASFDLIDPVNQKNCFQWLNMQPLAVSANRSKQDKYNEETELNQFTTLLRYLEYLSKTNKELEQYALNHL